ncbi:glutamate 5-kinase [Sulfitobacter sabulilitoris]|uniref:Glutamate 5-kinase n=1 Tax=Sulfitobacter sabulilitoris TaxID=2562655 RepID=A0A5S3PJQ9_9RHOB|nr:glutamate 5-kinase [Sulfitobacter sabulilitoris]TMM54648.1 glutamate 5-kinase [Sulfitobacter sabulilitoris]
MASLMSADILVVKIGSALLVDKESGDLRIDWLQSVAEDVAWLRKKGIRVVLVSSGSIALGRRVLNLPATALPLEQSQAAAAVGQSRLARAYEEVLAPHGITTAQVLVTLDDSSDRRRYLNTRATLETLVDMNVVPVVNENDTVATDKIRYGDNDRLAAQVAVTVGADQLILLSDVDGLYTANPSVDPTATRFDEIDDITPEIEDMAGDPVSGLSKGGMKTKLMAAKTAVYSGCAMAITEGSAMNPLQKLEAGANATWFTAHGDPKTARKQWIASMKPTGQITIDAGAIKALDDGRSLLPAGVTAVSGVFGRGDPVSIVDAQGHVLGQGLTRYTSNEATKIIGARTRDIESLLGRPSRASLIHRDDMAF